MDESRYDDERCGIAAAGSGRRGVLKALAASGLVAALGRLAGGSAAAKKTAKGPCGGKCGTFCDPRTAIIFCDPTNENCVCVRATSGKIECGDTSQAHCPPPGSRDKCALDVDCGADAICVKTLGGLCCSDSSSAQVNVCVPRCTGAPGAARASTGDDSLLGVRHRLTRR